MNAITQLSFGALLAVSTAPEPEGLRHCMLEAATGTGFIATGMQPAPELPAVAQERLLRFFSLPDAGRMRLARRKVCPTTRSRRARRARAGPAPDRAGSLPLPR